MHSSSVSGLVIGTDISLFVNWAFLPFSTLEKTGAQNSSGVFEIPIIKPFYVPVHGISLVCLNGNFIATVSCIYTSTTKIVHLFKF